MQPQTQQLPASFQPVFEAGGRVPPWSPQTHRGCRRGAKKKKTPPGVDREGDTPTKPSSNRWPSFKKGIPTLPPVESTRGVTVSQGRGTPPLSPLGVTAVPQKPPRPSPRVPSPCRLPEIPPQVPVKPWGGGKASAWPSPASRAGGSSGGGVPRGSPKPPGAEGRELEAAGRIWQIGLKKRVPAMKRIPNR